MAELEQSSRDYFWPLIEILIYPTIFTVGCWMVDLCPEVFSSFLRTERKTSGDISHGSEVAAPLVQTTPVSQEMAGRPKGVPLPKSRLSAWRLGRLAGILESSTEVEGEIFVSEAATVLGVPREDIDLEAVRGLGDLILQVDGPSARVSKGSTIFTMANCLWTVAILGLMATLWPFLVIVGSHILNFINHIIPPDFLHWLAVDVLQPLASLLFRLEPLWVFLVMLACLYLVVLSTRLKSGVKEWTALAGVALSVATFSYSAVSPLPDFLSGRVLLTWCFLYLTLSLVPLARAFSSTLIGSFAPLTLSLGIISLVNPENYVVEAYCLSSLLVAALLFCCQVRGLNDTISPFRYGLYLFGTVSFFAFLLILSNYWYKDSKAWYFGSNVVTVLFLGSAFMLGNSFDVKSLRSTSVLFAILWVFAKLIDGSALFGDDGAIVAWFLSFLVMFGVAFVLKDNAKDISADLLP